MEDILLDHDSDPDKQFCNDNGNFYDAPNFSSNKANDFSKQNKDYNFSILHLNIRSVMKYIDSHRILLPQINFSFKAICLTETWCEQENESDSSLYNLPNYTCIHQVWNGQKVVSVCIYAHNSPSMY